MPVEVRICDSEGPKFSQENLLLKLTSVSVVAYTKSQWKYDSAAMPGTS